MEFGNFKIPFTNCQSFARHSSSKRPVFGIANLKLWFCIFKVLEITSRSIASLISSLFDKLVMKHLVLITNPDHFLLVNFLLIPKLTSQDRRLLKNSSETTGFMVHNSRRMLTQLLTLQIINDRRISLLILMIQFDNLQFSCVSFTNNILWLL